MKESEQKNNSNIDFGTINWLGLVTGVLMILLPFLGVWWEAVLGDGIVRIALSPFKYEAMLLGETLTSSLISYFIIAAKISVILGGIFIFLGSIGAKKWWGIKLVNWGAMRVFWMIISLLVLLVIGAILMNNYLASFLSGMAEGGKISLNLPYLIGSGHATVSVQETVTISGEIKATLTPSFWIAVITAGLGIGAKIYQKKSITFKKSN